MADPTTGDLFKVGEAFGIVAAVAIPAGLLAFAIAYRAGTKVFPRWRPWRTRWSGLDLILFAGLFVVLPGVATVAVDSSGVTDYVFGPAVHAPADAIAAIAGGPATVVVTQFNRERDFCRTASGSLVSLPVFLLAFGIARSRLRAEEPPQNPPFARLVGGIAVGVAAWVVLTPVTLLVNFAVTAVYSAAGGVPDEHPLTLLNPGRSVLMTVLFFTAACVVTPLFEEMLFRRLLLPWALGASYRSWILMALAGVVAAGRDIVPGQPIRIGPPVFVLFLAAAMLALEYGLPARPRYRKRVCSSVVSTATLFAAMHSAVWPSPVPLFVLALGLGYIVARTHGVTAAAVCHGLFNAVSAVMLLRSPG